MTVLTGAGISAESGVPTFRDAQPGLWANFKPEELATPEAFQRNARTVWEWYEWRRQRVRAVAPNAGHLALVEIEKRVPEFTLVTQNVDGLHQPIGTSAIVYPAASLPFTALRAGAMVVEVNPAETPLTEQAAHFLCGPSGQVLPALVKTTWK